MNFLRTWIACGLLLALPGSLCAVQIDGKVIDIAGDTATISMDGDVLPSVGDKVDVFFKIGDAEVSVGSGKVTEATAGSIKARIDNTTGSVAKEQFVRIETSRKSATEKIAPAKGPATTPAAGAGSALEGSWTGIGPEQSVVSFSFQPDNKLLWLVTDAISGAATYVHAKYRTNTAATPNTLEIFDISDGEMKGLTLRGFFELQSDGRLKIDLSEKEAGGFSDRETILMTRASSPLVIPTDAHAVTSAAPVDPTPDPSKPPDEQKLSLGDERYDAKDLDGAIKAFTEAINLNPKNASAWKKRGHAFHSKDDYDSAIADWTKAITLDPSYKEDLDWLIKQVKAVKETRKDLKPRAPAK